MSDNLNQPLFISYVLDVSIFRCVVITVISMGRFFGVLVELQSI
ncbi:hypothetical protein XBP1_1120019 [Xenorhabdus bovienii str. puntauvense]|uniref:Uncharacterized protein n=2 Tax=Xenorhabdus bovienii TaxID=40576 RepID=A0A0B6X862_XENBV|nr:hypothetical protein XBP1_1120019 [Xenorhabdus bovienii str. puntauvense]CDM90102.1 protein of unknown function [Xenorhabdus bovienii]